MACSCHVYSVFPSKTGKKTCHKPAMNLPFGCHSAGKTNETNEVVPGSLPGFSVSLVRFFITSDGCEPYSSSHPPLGRFCDGKTRQEILKERIFLRMFS
mgnify:CR=1 FL=1